MPINPECADFELFHSKNDPIKLRILKVFSFFSATVLVSNPVYTITVIFIYLLSDKASNSMQTFSNTVFTCELYHT